MANEPREAHCLLALRRIEEIDWDATLRGIQTSGFGRYLPYDFKTGNVGHLGEFVLKRIDSSVCLTVEREFGHEGAYIAWKANNPRATLTSCQTEIDGACGFGDYSY